MIEAHWITESQGGMELRIPTEVLAERVAQALHLAQQGQFDQAQTLLPADPDERGLDALVLAGLYWNAGQLDAAYTCFVRACEDLDHPLVINEMARFLSMQGRRVEAAAYRRRALEKNPDQALLWANLGDDLIALGQTAEGLEHLKRAVTLAPTDPVIGSMWLSSLHYGEHLDPAVLIQEHLRWGQLFSRTPEPAACLNLNPQRPLRIGYVSSDFRSHSVAFFLEPLLQGHDRERVEVFGYGNVTCPDEVTTRLIGQCDHYRDIQATSDEQAADLIRLDRIDILVDLGGHFRGHRLGIFALKPAPIQVTYLGYPDTTGLAQIDYRLIDPWADGPEANAYYSEKLWRLEEGFLCYRPPEDAPEVGPLPAWDAGGVTFGCFNHNAKITDQVIQLWARILHKVTGSRLLMKFATGSEPTVKERYLLAFEKLGISPNRIEVMGWQPVGRHWNLYGRVDIALDTYPYHGTTTTCEALWMGVPVISLVGQHHASRVGWSLLNRLGLERCAAHEPQEYVAKAVSLAGQLETLAKLRAHLRVRMAASGLCRAGDFCRGLERAYRAMWQETVAERDKVMES